MKDRLLIFLSRQIIACNEADYLVSLQHDHKLGFVQWWQLKVHLIACHYCRKYAHQIVQLDAAIETYRKAASNGHCIHHLPGDRARSMEVLLAGEGDANTNDMLKSR